MPATTAAMADAAILAAFAQALDAAEARIGATAPNPPVGCAALDADGRVLAVAAHERAGAAHAEVLALAACRAAGLLPAVRVLVVTLEPCNHHGRTPPCTEAILAAGVPEVWIGADDPDPRVAGGGGAALAAGGVRVRWIGDEPGGQDVASRCRALIAPFAKAARTGLPWIVVKRALDPAGSMIPPPGAKTFTSPASLAYAHLLRRRADAIITGSGTVLADAPEFTVRHLADHPGKRRPLLVLDRRRRTPAAWLRAAEARGFLPVLHDDADAAIRAAGAAGALTLLVEAGPAVTGAVLDGGHWDECVTITASGRDDVPDSIAIERRPGS